MHSPDANIYVPLEYDEEAIPGEAGIDYPVYQTVPDTLFTCDAQEHPGLYADIEAQCQVSARGGGVIWCAGSPQ